MMAATSSGSSMLTSCVSSSAKTMPVNGERMVPPRIAPMLTSGQKPGAFVRQEHGFEAAQRAAHHQQRRQHAARGAGAERDGPDGRLHQQDAEDDGARHVALQQRPDGVVADAQRLREDQTADADGQAADGRPPHPVDRQVARRASSARVDADA